MPRPPRPLEQQEQSSEPQIILPNGQRAELGDRLRVWFDKWDHTHGNMPRDIRKVHDGVLVHISHRGSGPIWNERFAGEDKRQWSTTNEEAIVTLLVNEGEQEHRYGYLLRHPSYRFRNLSVPMHASVHEGESA